MTGIRNRTMGGGRPAWFALHALAILYLSAILSLCASFDVYAATENPVQARDFSAVGDDRRVRVQIRFDAAPEFATQLLRNPERLAIDLPAVRFNFDERALTRRGFLSDVRYGAMAEGKARILLAFKGPFRLENAAIQNDAEGDPVLVIDIVSATPDDFLKELAKSAAEAQTVRATPKSDRLGQDADTEPGSRKFTIVIDPGHGGIDAGAKGVSGIDEKTVTLAFGLELRKRLEETGLYRVVMTRDDDEFVPLDDRVRIGRQEQADLFLSIHADTIKIKSIRGATVYTLSERASDSLAESIAANENLSDEIAGVAVDGQQLAVNDILIDLIRRETNAFSVRFARTLVKDLSTKVELIKNPHRSAGFRVLVAHDMPSVLLELGYLSNPADEKLLRDPEWRAKAQGSILEAVALFAKAREGAGG